MTCRKVSCTGIGKTLLVLISQTAKKAIIFKIERHEFF